MQVQAYLHAFNGRCEEAINFYKKTLNAEVVMMMRFKDSPEPMSPECSGAAMADRIMHAALHIGEGVVMMSDGGPSASTTFQGFSLSLNAASQAEAERLFAALADGGQIQMSLGKTFWAAAFGMLVDRFGVGWMVNFEA